VVGWLLAGKLAWVIAYDTEYAMVDRNDDLKIGIRTSAITLGRFDVARGDDLVRGLHRLLVAGGSTDRHGLGLRPVAARGHRPRPCTTTR
jgi:4-hydroxybenzoate polyprenyltransferase